VKLKFTKHAEKRRLGRGIVKDEIKLAIKKGMRKIRKDGAVVSKHGGVFVVWKKARDTYIIITVG
jgi:hypothetical protein